MDAAGIDEDEPGVLELLTGTGLGEPYFTFAAARAACFVRASKNSALMTDELLSMSRAYPRTAENHLRDRGR